MTVPAEERSTLHRVHDFLLELTRPCKTPRVPQSVREGAGRLLRHYPAQHRIDELFANDPKWCEYEKMVNP